MQSPSLSFFPRRTRIPLRRAFFSFFAIAVWILCGACVTAKRTKKRADKLRAKQVIEAFFHEAEKDLDQKCVKMAAGMKERTKHSDESIAQLLAVMCLQVVAHYKSGLLEHWEKLTGQQGGPSRRTMETITERAQASYYGCLNVISTCVSLSREHVAKILVKEMYRPQQPSTRASESN